MEETTVASPETVETPIAEQAVNTENAEPSKETVETPPEKTFTQSELNDIITKRIERERESVTKKASQEARDAYIAEQGYEWQGKRIATESEYKQALKDKEVFDSLKERDLPDEVIQEMIENRNFREQYTQKEQTQAQKEKIDADFKAFFEEHPTIDPNNDIPVSVWEDVQKGKSLLDAYAKHENKVLKQKLAEAEQKKQVEQQNQANAASSTGSVVGNGSVLATAFTREQVEAMSNEDMKKNYTQVIASMKTWKK